MQYFKLVSLLACVSAQDSTEPAAAEVGDADVGDEELAAEDLEEADGEEFEDMSFAEIMEEDRTTLEAAGLSDEKKKEYADKVGKMLETLKGELDSLNTSVGKVNGDWAELRKQVIKSDSEKADAKIGEFKANSEVMVNELAMVRDTQKDLLDMYLDLERMDPDFANSLNIKPYLDEQLGLDELTAQPDEGDVVEEVEGDDLDDEEGDDLEGDELEEGDDEFVEDEGDDLDDEDPLADEDGGEDFADGDDVIAARIDDADDKADEEEVSGVSGYVAALFLAAV